jgi:RNA polymerase sigma-70 factor (ECF subfamily)
VNSDFADIQACINGDTGAYKRLIMKYEADLTRLMWRFTRDKTECEGLVQDVFVEAYLNLRSYQGRGPFLNWLKRIGTRTGYRFWKERYKAGRCVSLQNCETPFEKLTVSIRPQDAAELLHILLSRLPDKDRLILTLMYLEECDTREIARRMGWTHTAVKMRAMRARNKIKNMAENGLLEKLGWKD